MSWEGGEMMKRDDVVAWTGDSGLIDRRRESRDCEPRYNEIASRLVLNPVLSDMWTPLNVLGIASVHFPKSETTRGGADRTDIVRYP